MKFCEYFETWANDYKKGVVREVTFKKYLMAIRWVKKIAPDLDIKDLDRREYQRIINAYGETHERTTVKDFNTLLKACLSDAFDEKDIDVNPAKKVAIKGLPSKEKKKKFLSKNELSMLLKSLDLNTEGKPNKDWLILLVAKTGLRFAEALAVTPADFDFENRLLTIDKSMDYKTKGKMKFQPTKNASSVRKVELDWQTTSLIMNRLKNADPNKPAFCDFDVHEYNDTYNHLLFKKCKKLGIPAITMHGLRHTHASLLIYAGVSMLSVSKRLGHANMSTTQNVYLHVVDELANKDSDIAIGFLSVL